MRSASALFVIVVFASITLLYIFSSIVSERQPKPEVERQPKPEVERQPKPEVERQPKPEVERQPKPEVERQPKPEGERQPKPEVVRQPKPEVERQPKPEVVRQPKPEVERQPKPEVERQPKPEVERQPKPEVARQPKPEVERQPKPEVERQPKPEVFDSYENLEKLMCRNAGEWNKTMYQSRKGPCPKKGIVSFHYGGRTGNQMWVYASIWGVARHTGLDPYIPGCIKSKLRQIFEQLTVPDLREIAHCPVEFNTFVESIEKWTSTNQSIILYGYNWQIRVALTWVQDLMQEFRFSKKLRDKAQQTLTGFIGQLPPTNYTFVGVHVRRTDYVGHLKTLYGESLVNPEFFKNAMAYYKSKYPNCLFIYISDDPTWCFNQFGNLKDVFVASYNTTNTPAEDLAIMTACNHTIFDYGTFGEWGSILAGGETVYNNMTENIGKGTGRVMKNWTPMN